MNEFQFHYLYDSKGFVLGNPTIVDSCFSRLARHLSASSHVVDFGYAIA